MTNDRAVRRGRPAAVLTDPQQLARQVYLREWYARRQGVAIQGPQRPRGYPAMPADQKKANRLAYEWRHRAGMTVAQRAKKAETIRKCMAANAAANRALLYGGSCLDCGASGRLERDHRDPSTKLFNVARRLHWSLASLLPEVAKTNLVCQPCHLKRTRERRLAA